MVEVNFQQEKSWIN